jgi:uncharacterized phage-associated protein
VVEAQDKTDAVTAHAVANAFIDLAKRESTSLTNMQLQKLVFLGQGYCLALLDRVLYRNNTHAWQWGPVVPKLYKALQKYGSGVVPEAIPAIDKLVQTDELNIVHGVWKAYGHYTGSQLSALTHKPDSPWAKTWETEKFGVIDPNEIKAYYRRLVSKS